MLVQLSEQHDFHGYSMSNLLVVKSIALLALPLSTIQQLQMNYNSHLV